MQVTTNTTNRPLAHVPNSLLLAVVKRGKYNRYSPELGKQLQAELSIRSLISKRIN